MKALVSMTLGALAEHIGARLRGDPNCVILGIAPIEKAGKGKLTFLSSRLYKKYLATTDATAVILSAEDEAACPDHIHALISENPRLSLVKAATLFEKRAEIKSGIHPSVVIGVECIIPASVIIGPYSVLGDGVTLGENVVIGSHCSIGNDCHIQAATTLKSRVTLYERTRVGKKCLIHSGAVIGSDGFGFANQEDIWVKMPHLGGVYIGNDVEIGANTTIDRGFIEDTQIEDGVIIDNLVQLGHNVSIGARTAIAGCVGIAGSTTVGKYCLIGGGASIAGHIQIADHVHITATSAVNHSLNTKGVYSSGFPAKPAALWRKNAARFQFLDDIARRLRALENTVQAERLTEDE